MFSFIVGVIAALFGLSLGLGALMLVLVPVFLVVIVALLPVLLGVVLLRRLGVVRGRFASLVVFLVGVGLLAGLVDRAWSRGNLPLSHWLDAKRAMLEACKSEDGQPVTIERDQDGVHFSCHIDGNRARKPPSPQEDAHI